MTPTLTSSPLSTQKDAVLPIRQPEVKEADGLLPREPRPLDSPTRWNRPVVEDKKNNVKVTTTPAPPESDGLRVLLVEDNEINLKLLVAYMRKLKLDHTTATNGLEALNAYKDCNGKYDVVFMGS